MGISIHVSSVLVFGSCGGWLTFTASARPGLFLARGGESLWTRIWCCFMLPLCANALPQTLQLNGFSPVCDRICTFRCHRLPGTFFPQIGHSFLVGGSDGLLRWWVAVEPNRDGSSIWMGIMLDVAGLLLPTMAVTVEYSCCRRGAPPASKH